MRHAIKLVNVDNMQSCTCLCKNDTRVMRVSAVEGVRNTRLQGTVPLLHVVEAIDHEALRRARSPEVLLYTVPMLGLRIDLLPVRIQHLLDPVNFSTFLLIVEGGLLVTLADMLNFSLEVFVVFAEAYKLRVHHFV